MRFYKSVILQKLQNKFSVKAVRCILRGTIAVFGLFWSFFVCILFVLGLTTY